MGDVNSDVTPNDEFSANYLVSYAVGILRPAEIWQLRNSAAGHQPHPGQVRLILTTKAIRVNRGVAGSDRGDRDVGAATRAPRNNI